MKGNCYYSSEALFHILGGKRAGWKPMVMRLPVGPRTGGGSHWFLQHKSGLILDPSVRQFKRWRPDYTKGRGCGFLTKHPSKRARALMGTLTYFQELPDRGQA